MIYVILNLEGTKTKILTHAVLWYHSLHMLYSIIVGD